MFGAKLSWCLIVLVPNFLGAKLSVFIILVPNCLLYYLGVKLSGAKLSGAKLSYNRANNMKTKKSYSLFFYKVALPPSHEFDTFNPGLN